MEHFAVAVNTVLPLFLLIGLGYIAKQKHIISPSAVQEANRLSFYLFMSVLLFYNVYSSDLSVAFDERLVLFCIVGILAEFLIGLLLIPRIEKTPSARGVMLQSFFRTNSVLLGIPITTSLFGAEHTGQAAVIMAFVVPVLNIFSVVAFELFRDKKVTYRKVLKGIAKNPLVIGTLSGAFFALTGLCFPAAVERAVSNIAGAATPLALVLMGASLDFSKFKSTFKNMTICVLERLIISPILFLSIAILMGFQGPALCAVMVTFATPVAVNSYNTAEQMGGDTDLASGIVLLTTGLSCITLTGWIWLLKTFGLF